MALFKDQAGKYYFQDLADSPAYREVLPGQYQGVAQDLPQAASIIPFGGSYTVNGQQVFNTKPSLPGAVSSSDSVVAEENNVKSDVSNLSATTVDEKGVRDASKVYQDKLQSQIDDLEKRRKSEVDSINANYEQAKIKTEDAQKRETGAYSAALQRIGGYLGESASGTGAMLTLAQTHRNELTALEGKRSAAVQAANNAITDKQFALAKEIAAEIKALDKEIYERKNTYFNQVVKMQEEERAQQEEERKKTKFKREEEEALAEDIVGALYSMLGPDNDKNNAFITQSAKDYGLDPNLLITKVNEYAQKRRLDEIKEYTPDIKNYRFAVDQGYKGSLIDFIKMQESIKKAQSVGTGQYGLRVDDPIYFATLRMTTDKGREAAIARYALMKKEDPASAERFVDTIIYSKLSAAERKEFELFQRASNSAGKILQKISTFENANFNPYKTAVEQAKPLAMLNRDQDWVDVVSNIGLAQAQVRNSLFGTALTPTEQATANSFLIDMNADDIETARTKLKNMREFAQDLKVQKFAFGSGDFEEGGGSDEVPLTGDDLFRANAKKDGWSDEEIEEYLAKKKK